MQLLPISCSCSVWWRSFYTTQFPPLSPDDYDFAMLDYWWAILLFVCCVHSEIHSISPIYSFISGARTDVRCFHMKSLFSSCRQMSIYVSPQWKLCCMDWSRKRVCKEEINWVKREPPLMAQYNISVFLFSLNKSMLGWVLFILIVGWRMLAVTAVPLCIICIQDTGYIYWDWWDESSERANEVKSRRINNDDNYGQRRETTRHCTALELCQTTRRFFYLLYQHNFT